MATDHRRPGPRAGLVYHQPPGRDLGDPPQSRAGARVPRVPGHGPMVVRGISRTCARSRRGEPDRAAAGRARVGWPVVSLSESQHAAVAALIDVPPVADELGRRFAAAGHQLHLVGGPVRDALLGGRAPQDLDFATDARPERILQVVAGWAEATWTTGIAYGTVGVSRRGHRLEITTFRADRYDRVSRNPAVEYGESLEADLRRRDFTVNAMALSV